jgi:hypothetical protein
VGDDEEDLAEQKQRHYRGNEGLEVLRAAHTLPGQGVHVQRNEEPVQQVVGQYSVQAVNVEAEDVVQIVEVVKVFSHQILRQPK